jgi:hypothetical protein
VSNTSGADKFRAFSRVVGRRAGEHPVTKATYVAGRGFLATVRHVVQGLFHQITGLFFLIFGLVVGYAGIREYRAYLAGLMGPGRSILAGVLALMFFYFAISAFVRAGRKKT